MIYFNITDWFYWGEYYLDNNEPNIKKVEKKVELTGISSLQKRRFPDVAKKINAFFLAANTKNEPIIYTSKYGQLAKTMAIIRGFADEVSPAKFSMSVHNAIPGLLSATHQSKIPYQTIDSMAGMIEMAMFEASSLLNKHPAVNVVYFDESLSSAFYSQQNNALNDAEIENNSVVLALRLTAGSTYGLQQQAHDNQQLVKDEDQNRVEFVNFLADEQKS